MCIGRLPSLSGTPIAPGKYFRTAWTTSTGFTSEPIVTTSGEAHARITRWSGSIPSSFRTDAPLENLSPRSFIIGYVQKQKHKVMRFGQHLQYYRNKESHPYQLTKLADNAAM